MVDFQKNDREKSYIENEVALTRKLEKQTKRVRDLRARYREQAAAVRALQAAAEADRNRKARGDVRSPRALQAAAEADRDPKAGGDVRSPQGEQPELESELRAVRRRTRELEEQVTSSNKTTLAPNIDIGQVCIGFLLAQL